MLVRNYVIIVVYIFQRYPEDAELLYNDIFKFGWMKSIWGPIPEVRPPRQSIASSRGGASSKKVIEEDDDNFTPSKQAQKRGKAPFAFERGGCNSKKPSKKAQNWSKACSNTKW